jgi:hypothetical protein
VNRSAKVAGSGAGQYPRGKCGTEQGPALRWQGANLAGPSAFQRCSLRCAELILFRIVFGLRGGTVGCVSRSHFPSHSASATTLFSASPDARRRACSETTRWIGVSRPGAPVRNSGRAVAAKQQPSFTGAYWLSRLSHRSIPARRVSILCSSRSASST